MTAGLVDLWWLDALVALVALALGALGGAIAYFGRDPEREVTTAPNSILSAADGWVSAVRKLTYDDLLKQIAMDDLQQAILAASWNLVSNFWLVSVFMPVTDVHVNRAPLTGIVTAMVHRRGEFRPLSETETTNQRRNERNAMFIQGERISVAVVQIAGMLGRRIVCRVSPGDTVKQGGRIGWIRLGSQVDVVFPALDQMTIQVRRHSKVKAGIHGLASLNHSELEREGIREPSDQSRISRLVGIAFERLLNWTLMSYLYIKLSVRFIYSRVKHGAGSEGA